MKHVTVRQAFTVALAVSAIALAGTAISDLLAISMGYSVQVAPVREWGFGELDLDGTTSVTIQRTIGCVRLTHSSPR